MSLTIRTSQNVLLEYEPASIGERILAALIDYVIFLGWFILVFAIPAVFKLKTDNVFYVLLVMAPIVFYDLLCEWLMNGRSFGKLAMKIRVVKLDGSPPDLGAYLIRWMLRIVESVAFMGGLIPVITVAANGKGQRLGDIAAGTTVVRLKPAVSLNDVIIRPSAENYIAQFPDVRHLSDRDINIVIDVLRQGDENVAARTANKIKEVTGIHSNLANREFLLAVVNDYQFITAQ
jgi:uncharacterized RDD family membrane protein YckC